MTTLLITGGCGFIGSNFIRYWLNRHTDDRIVNLDLLTYAGNPDNLRDMDDNPRYCFAHGDIGDAQLVAALLEEYAPEYIVNFAAESHNSRAVLCPADCFRVNLLGTQTLLDAARRAQTPRFHQISTCEVFGDMALDSTDAFHEDSPYRPNAPYSAAKAAADLAVHAYGKTFNLPVSISICANNYGPYQFPEKLIPHFAVRLMRGTPMPLYQNRHYRREWLHVQDHCRALEAILLRGAIGETYNIGSATELTIEEVADRMLTIFGLDASYKMTVADRPGHDRRYLLCADKIHRQLGWHAQTTIDQGFADTVEWYQQNTSWWEPLLNKITADETQWR